MTITISYKDQPEPGGFQVHPLLNERIPQHLREYDGFYSDADAWAKLCIALPKRFSHNERVLAWDTLRERYPESYKTEIESLIQEFKEREVKNG
jgi:hypothetical protein